VRAFQQRWLTLLTLLFHDVRRYCILPTLGRYDDMIAPSRRSYLRQGDVPVGSGVLWWYRLAFFV